MKSRRSIAVPLCVRIPAAVLVALFALSACAGGRIPFTQTLRDQYGLEGDELKKLQYFISSDVTLQREFHREEGEISKSHKLVIKEGGLVDEVYIAAGTPGIATEVSPTSLSVSFEPGGSLIFGSPPPTWTPNGNTSSRPSGGPTTTGNSSTTTRSTTPCRGAARSTSRSAWNRSTRWKRRRKSSPG